MTSELRVNSIVEGKARTEQISGIDHLVVPVVAAKVGVMNGLFYSENELSSFVGSWNGVPVPVYHPVDGYENITANSPEIENKQNIGRFYNVVFSDKKLKGEIWIDINKANKLGYSSIINKFENGELMEVSTGLVSNIRERQGVFNGEKYTGEVFNIRPDHLALLPDQEGACSLKDGCGAMKVNCECKKTEIEKMNSAIDLVFNQLSFGDTRKQIQQRLLSENDSDSPFPFVDQVFDDFFVYEVDGIFFKRGYSLQNDVVSLEDPSTAVEVVRKTEFNEVINNVGRGKEIMQTNEDVKEEDYQESVSEEVKESDSEEVKEESSEEVVESEDKEEVQSNSKETVESVLGNIKDPEVRQFLTNGAEQLRKEKKETVQYLVDNGKGLSESELTNMDLSVLKKLKDSMRPAGNYAGQNPVSLANESVSKAPVPPSVYFRNVKGVK